ncbi:rhomboid family intramembrane serine protease [Candidatus Bathyarchaeota archaeon]|nr:MAG: rhomboid family intramembrane serine protease [Candidatus Bathyarchaeota archaeon]
MEQSQSSRIRDSPTVQMAAVLTSVYVLFGWLGGDFVTLNIFVALPLVQINSAVRQGSVWMLFTSMFLHANLLHLGGNLLFLLIFGTVLEEQVSRERWLATFLASGLTGNIEFLLIGPLLGQEVGLGASGAIYGLLGAAGGAKGAIAMIFLLGLNLFAGGGELAHTFGLVTGILLHEWGDRAARFLHGQASTKF